MESHLAVILYQNVWVQLADAAGLHAHENPLQGLDRRTQRTRRRRSAQNTRNPSEHTQRSPLAMAVTFSVRQAPRKLLPVRLERTIIIVAAEKKASKSRLRLFN
uniref:(northern house mosquito) hypothetical protein n=1 Tax=Culex pipiens TaxID=7175 RepID=A0A8D8FJ98_CULPI